MPLKKGHHLQSLYNYNVWKTINPYNKDTHLLGTLSNPNSVRFHPRRVPLCMNVCTIIHMACIPKSAHSYAYSLMQTHAHAQTHTHAHMYTLIHKYQLEQKCFDQQESIDSLRAELEVEHAKACEKLTSSEDELVSKVHEVRKGGSEGVSERAIMNVGDWDVRA